MSITSKFTLLSGREIPSVGLGTYPLFGKNVKLALDMALSEGYRLIDTAVMYHNERDIGDALQELLPRYNLKREDIFIVSKLYPLAQGNQARDSVKQSIKNLGCGYLDLYLIHWPGAYDIPKGMTLKQLRFDSWHGLVNAKKDGLVKDIGVSNYTVKHLKELFNNSYGEMPVVNQIEWHPYCHDEEIKKFCDSQGILVQGYMPLGGVGNINLQNDPDAVRIAKTLNKTWAQVVLRWAVKQNICVIPKSTNRSHMAANLSLNFDISAEDMTALSNNKIFKRVDWDPNEVP